MPGNDTSKSNSGHISDFERAVCYYTLPRVTSPVTFGLVIAYAVCFLEAVGVTVYGFIWENETYARAGVIALIGITIFGIAAFLVRAFMNEVRKQRALASAKGIQDVSDEAGDLPDPFKGHVLLRFHREKQSGLARVTDNEGNLRYSVTTRKHGRAWLVEDADGDTHLKLDGRWGGRSFNFDFDTPMHLLIYKDDIEVARLDRRRGFANPPVDIVCGETENDRSVARGLSFYKDDRLVGRIYRLRGYTYLDIEGESFNEGVLGFFVAMA